MKRLTMEQRIAKMNQIRADCAFCGRRFSTRIPAGGDGSVRVVSSHGNSCNAKCAGSGKAACGWGAERCEVMVKQVTDVERKAKRELRDCRSQI